MIQIAPLFSSGALPQVAKVGIALFVGIVVFPGVLQAGYVIPTNVVHYALLLVGEALIGIITGFFLVLIYSAFQIAGQFFSLQMGFGASQVFDPLAQIEIPLMGQFLNIVAMYVFVVIGGFQKFMLQGVYASFQAVRAVDLVTGGNRVFQMMFGALGQLFEAALNISFPILGTLFLVSISMGLLAKAAPQMNLLMMGFPIAIGVAFLVIFVTTPFLMEAFSRLIELSFDGLLKIFRLMQGGPA